jgi:UMF1 family MFS transporter
VGWFSTRFGRRPATAVCLAGWVVVLALSWFVTTPTQLHALAVLLALVLGGIQSVLRATIAALAPAGHAAASFGVMQVGTKLAGFVASLAFGGVQLVAHEPRAGLVVLLGQLALGSWFFLRRPPAA